MRRALAFLAELPLWAVALILAGPIVLVAWLLGDRDHAASDPHKETPPRAPGRRVTSMSAAERKAFAAKMAAGRQRAKQTAQMPAAPEGGAP